MKSVLNKRGLFFGASAAVLIVAGLPATPTFAQEGPSQADKDGFKIDELVITARKREESLQDTPVAVTALTGDELSLRQIDSTSSLADVTPNLTFDPVAPSSGSNSASQIYIRGVGQSDFTLVTDPGVGLYIDGIYMSRSIGSIMDFLDIERIEVLRGPQGTLFGRNTIGGAVLVHSRRPTDEFSASAKIEYGDDNKFFFTGNANLPLSEKASSRITVSRRVRDGYITRVADGVDLGNDDTYGVRGSLLLNPTENFEAYFIADYTNEDENGAPIVSGGVNDLQLFGAIANLLDPGCPVASLAPPARETNGNPACANETAFIGEYSSGGTFPVASQLEAWGGSATFDWQVVDALNIKSITSYRETNGYFSRDADGTRFNIFQTQNTWDHQQFSQEFQFAGKLIEDRLNWMVGLYYFDEEGTDYNPITIPTGNLLSGGQVNNDSVAAFTQATFDLTDALSFTLGARYTEDTKRFTPDQYITGAANPALGGPPNAALSPIGPLAVGSRILPLQEFEKKFDDISMMANIAYRWSEALMTYVTYSEGYKSGGFDQRFAAPPINPITSLPTNAPDDFDPETVESIELGAKADLFDNRLRVNFAYFHTDYQNLQLVIRETFNPVTFNGGSALIDGAELEVTFVPTSRWMVTGGVGYMDARYDELSASVISNATPILPSYRLVNTPEWSGNLGVAYEMPLYDWGTLIPRVDWSFHGNQYNDAINTPQLKQDDYHLLNAALSFESEDGHWQAAITARNITDETYLVTGNSAFTTSAAYLEQVYGRGFEWGMSLTYNLF